MRTLFPRASRIAAARSALAVLLVGLASTAMAQVPAVDWKAERAEILRHYSALVQIDTSNPPGNETLVANYLKGVRRLLERHGGEQSAVMQDAMDKAAVDAHADRVVAAVGSIDVSFNAVAVPAVQGVALTEIAVEDFMAPITGLCRTNFLTATTAARHMAAQGAGVIVTLSASSAKETRHEMGGFSLANAAIEAREAPYIAGTIGAS